jgi:hypothetical protein
MNRPFRLLRQVFSHSRIPAFFTSFCMLSFQLFSVKKFYKGFPKNKGSSLFSCLVFHRAEYICDALDL